MFRPRARESKLSRRKNWSNFVQLSRLDSDIGRKLFVESYTSFMQKSGLKIQRIPIMAKRPLDLYRLFVTVQRLGGFEQVVKHRQWSRVVRELQLPSSITSAAFTLRTQYYKFLFPYEHSQENILSHSGLEQASVKMKSAMPGCYHPRTQGAYSSAVPTFEALRQCCGHPELLNTCFAGFNTAPIVTSEFACDDKFPFNVTLGVKRGQSNTCTKWTTNRPCNESDSMRTISTSTRNVRDDGLHDMSDRKGNIDKNGSPCADLSYGFRGEKCISRPQDSPSDSSDFHDGGSQRSELLPQDSSHFCFSNNQVQTKLKIAEPEHGPLIQYQVPQRGFEVTSPSQDDTGSSPKSPRLSCLERRECVRYFLFQRRDATETDLGSKHSNQDECKNNDTVKLYLKQQSDKILLVTVVLNSVPFDGALFAEIDK